MTNKNYFKVGGSLRFGDPTYIARKADRDIYVALKQKEFCYVLNSRQMGKSSLRVRMMKILVQEGFKCVAIDLGILGRFASTEQWYGGLVGELWRKLRLSWGIDDDLEWWRAHSQLSPVQRFSRFIADVLLARCDRDVVIFLDEVDNIISLDFRDEFLALIRSCYEKRVEAAQYSRLTFCLLGVATPSSLRIDKQLSPFNIGKVIGLEGFSFQEAQPLLAGLSFSELTASESETILREILVWTKGQPFLTQKLCALAVRHQQLVTNLPLLIQQHLVTNWEVQDEPEHLKTIRDRLLHNSHNKARFLTLYQQILGHQGIAIDGSEEQVELRLSGLVSAQQGKLTVSNPIYEQVFNRQWIEKQLAAISPYQNAIAAWVKSDCQDSSRLLRGQALIEGLSWAKKHSITAIEKEFLDQSEILAAQEQRQAQLAQQTEIAEGKLAQEKKLVRWQRLFIAFSLAMLGGFYLKSRQTNFSNINTLVQSSEALFASNQKLDSLIAAIKAKRQLNKSWRVNQNLVQQVNTVLQQSVYGIKETNRLLGHGDRLYSIAVGSKGKLMATAATDNTVRLWHNERSGWQPGKVLKHDGWVLDVAISSDRQTIASASRDRTAKVWNPRGKLLHTLKHVQPVTSVAISPQGQIVTGSEDGIIKIWQQNKAIQTLTGHTAAVESIAISPKGQIVTGSEDGTIKIWQQNKAIQTLTGHTGAIRAVAINQDGSRIVSASRDKTLKIWNSAGQEIATLKGHTAPVYSVAIDPLNNQIVSASGDRTLKIWNGNGIELMTLKGHTDRVWDVAYLPALSSPGGNVVSVSWDKTMRIWQPNNNFVRVSSGHEDVAIALDYQGNLIASTSDDRTVKLWSAKGTLLQTFREHTAEVYDVAIHQQTIASAGADRSLKIWQADGKLLHNISAHQAAIWAVEFSPDGRKIMTAGNDNLIKVWNINGQPLSILKGHTQKVWDLAIHPQGEGLASASEDNTIKIWDLNGHLLHSLTEHQDAVRTVAYSSDGSLLVSGSEDRTVKIWRSGKLITTLTKHQAAVKAVAISPDRQYIASVDDSGKIILWQQSNNVWQERQSLQAGNSIWSVVFSPDSQILATAGEDSKVMLWHLDSILQLDTLKYACTWAKDYLQHSPELDGRERRLCW
ncbi:MAG: AAA-like domain-containing protein [Cyanobacteria bacterium J06621_12]